MMNHQRQYNSNGSIQSEANCSTEALIDEDSSSSCTGRIQSSPNSLNVPNFLPHQDHLNTVRSNDHSAGVAHHNLDLIAEYVENGHFANNQNASAGLSLHPFEPDAPENQSDSNLSDLMRIDNGRSYVVDEQGVDKSLVNMSYFSSNRSPEHAPRELLKCESSTSAVQARIPISQAATVQVNTSNSLNIVASYICAANIHQQQFGAESGHETIRPVSNMQQFNEARHGSASSSLFSFEAGIDHAIARPVYDMLHFSHASPPAFVPSSNLSIGHARNFHVLSPSQTPQYYQQDHPHFFSQAQASVGAIPYGQIFVQFPYFHDILLPAPWVNVLGPIMVRPPFSPVYTVRGGRNPDNIPRTIMLGCQTGMGSQSPYVTNLIFGHGTASFLGNFASPSHYGPFSDSHLVNAPTGVPWFNASEQHIPMLFGAGNTSAAPHIGFPGPSINNQLGLNSPTISQRYENQSNLNTGPPFTDEARNNLLTQEMLRIDYSLLLYSPEDNNNEQDEEHDEENRRLVPGLSEEDIMAHLRLEEFQSPAEATPENVEPCCICQENYADGEDIGVLDCRHKFHYDCAKTWLRTKNTCPVCVRIGLAVI